MSSNNHQTFDKTDEDAVENGQYCKNLSVYLYNSGKSRNAEDEIRNKLKSLPKIKAGPGFSQKMTALFSLELEDEIRRKTYSLQLRNHKIQLPDLITDLSKEFL